MKKILTTLLFMTATLTSMQAQTPAFPGAEGHGRYVTGGRGGKVIHVTNLNDNGAGSFRAAVSGSAKKIVVFDVGGVIALNSNVSIGANTTIEGQTAPAPGITLRYYTVSPAGNNIIVRFLRVRRGQEKDVNDGADASTATNHTGIILDHCSFSWSIDEVASFYDNNNFTMQWCTIGESLNNAGHNKGAHGYGGIWGGKLASFHHNLICHVNNRSPRFNGARYDWTGFTGNQKYSTYKWANAVQAENVDFRNCVVYNCGNGCYGGPGGGYINMVGNYYKTGPAAKTSQLTKVSIGNSTSAEGHPIYWGMTSRYFLEGNLINDKEAGWSNVGYDSGTYTINGLRCSPDTMHYYGDTVTYYKNTKGWDCVPLKLTIPAPTDSVTTHSASMAFEKVLGYAGASLCRDTVDRRYMNEALTGTATYSGTVTGKAGRIDLVSDVKGYTEEDFGTGSRPEGFDSDGDGMPDDWEIANGLNPDANDASDYTIDNEVKYYTNIEVYCNSLVQKIMLRGNDDAEKAVSDYYPAYVNEYETKVEAINIPQEPSEPTGPTEEDVVYSLGISTNIGSNSNKVYYFDNDITISNTKSKSYSTAKEDGIKYSSGVSYTINLPEDIHISQIIFTGYDNYADGDSYISEVAGKYYRFNQYVFPKKSGSSYTKVSHTIDFEEPVDEKITFTIEGYQTVLAITLIGKKGTAVKPEPEPEVVGMNHVHANNMLSSKVYNLKGQVAKTKKGIIMENGNKIFSK